MSVAEIHQGILEAIGGLGVTTYLVRPQASDGGSDTVFPHYQIGPVVVAQWDTNSFNGFEVRARLYSRTRGTSAVGVFAMQAAIYERLHHGVIDAPGLQTILIEREASSTTYEMGATVGLCEYRFIFSPN